MGAKTRTARQHRQHQLRHQARKRGLQTSIEEVNFWRLDQATELMTTPSKQSAQEKKLSQNIKIFIPRYAVQTDLPADLAQVNKLSFTFWSTATQLAGLPTPY